MFARELSIAIDAARAAGAEIERMRAEGLRIGHKSGEELVSNADLRAAEMLHDALTGPFPGYGWLSEEHADSAARLECERTWIVDPIDGTREFIEGVPEYAVSVGLVVQGRPALGVVFNPATDELFSATVEAGAEQELRFPAASMESFRALVGRGEQYWTVGPVVLSGAPSAMAGARPRAVGSIAYRLALISAGEADLLMTSQPRREWDIAAGVALCLAAGFRVTDLKGALPQFNKLDPTVTGLLVACPSLYAEFIRHIRRP